MHYGKGGELSTYIKNTGILNGGRKKPKMTRGGRTKKDHTEQKEGRSASSKRDASIACSFRSRKGIINGTRGGRKKLGREREKLLSPN